MILRDANEYWIRFFIIYNSYNYLSVIGTYLSAKHDKVKMEPDGADGNVYPMGLTFDYAMSCTPHGLTKV